MRLKIQQKGFTEIIYKQNRNTCRDRIVRNQLYWEMRHNQLSNRKAQNENYIFRILFKPAANSRFWVNKEEDSVA